MYTLAGFLGLKKKPMEEAKMAADADGLGKQEKETAEFVSLIFIASLPI